MKTKFFFLILILFFISCSTLTEDTQKMEADRTYSFLALGDSYTIGESIDSNGRWPVQLADSLSGNGYRFEKPLIIARTGWTTDELFQGIEEADPDSSFDLVSLLIGVNNQYRGRDTLQFRQQFSNLLEHSIAFAGGKKNRVFVLSIPDWGVMPFAQGRDKQKIAEEIDAFNKVKKDVTQNAGVTYINITDISRQAQSMPSLVANDGLHPSSEMYSLWVKKSLPIVSEILDK